MNKIFLPAIFATALALTGCGKKEDQTATDGDTTPAEVTAPATAPATPTAPATAPTSEMQDLTAPAKSTDTDTDKTSELLDLTAPQEKEANS